MVAQHYRQMEPAPGRMEDMAPYAVGGRIAPRLNMAQLVRQAARLVEVRPELVAAYQEALRRWSGYPVLRLLGLPIVTEGYRSAATQDERYTHGRSAPGPVVTYKRGGESKHNLLPSRALGVAILLPDGSVVWSGLLLSKFARLVKAADMRVHLPRRGPRGLAGVQGPAAFRGVGWK